MSYASLRTEKATYWAPATANGYGGTSFATPVTLLVRWQDKRERLITPEGKEFISNAEVYCDQDLSRNGWLFRGVSTDASPPSGAYRIEMFNRSQNPSGTIVVQKAIL